MARVSLHGVRRVHADGTVALAGVDVEAHDGEVVGVIGPSGSGKSTLLRVVAGLDPLHDGLLRIGGRDVTAVPARARGVVWADDAAALASALDAVDALDPTSGVRGGGGPSRVGRRTGSRPSAAAVQRLRAMPTALLADDPLRLADPPSQTALRVQLRRVASATGVTTLWAANDHAQVLAVADRIVVLRAGRVVQEAPPAVLLARPRTRWVGGFVGRPVMTFIRAVLREDAGLGWIEVGDQRLRMPGGLPGPLRQRDGAAVDLGARPDVVRATEPADRADLRLHGVARGIRGLGAADEVDVELPTGTWTARFPAGCGLAAGALVEVTVDPRRLSAFDPGTGHEVWHGTG